MWILQVERMDQVPFRQVASFVLPDQKEERDEPHFVIGRPEELPHIRDRQLVVPPGDPAELRHPDPEEPVPS